MLPAIAHMRIPGYLVYESALEVDASGVGAREIASERLKGRWG